MKSKFNGEIPESMLLGDGKINIATDNHLEEFIKQTRAMNPLHNAKDIAAYYERIGEFKFDLSKVNLMSSKGANDTLFVPVGKGKGMVVCRGNPDYVDINYDPEALAEIQPLLKHLLTVGSYEGIKYVTFVKDRPDIRGLSFITLEALDIAAVVPYKEKYYEEQRTDTPKPTAIARAVRAGFRNEG